MLGNFIKGDCNIASESEMNKPFKLNHILNWAIKKTSLWGFQTCVVGVPVASPVCSRSNKVAHTNWQMANCSTCALNHYGLVKTSKVFLPESALQRPWPDCADAQPGLRICCSCCSHATKSGFLKTRLKLSIKGILYEIYQVGVIIIIWLLFVHSSMHVFTPWAGLLMTWGIRVNDNCINKLYRFWW